MKEEVSVFRGMGNGSQKGTAHGAQGNSREREKKTDDRGKRPEERRLKGYGGKEQSFVLFVSFVVKNERGKFTTKHTKDTKKNRDASWGLVTAPC